MYVLFTEEYEENYMNLLEYTTEIDGKYNDLKANYDRLLQTSDYNQEIAHQLRIALDTIEDLKKELAKCKEELNTSENLRKAGKRRLRYQKDKTKKVTESRNEIVVENFFESIRNYTIWEIEEICRELINGVIV